MVHPSRLFAPLAAFTFVSAAAIAATPTPTPAATTVHYGAGSAATAEPTPEEEGPDEVVPAPLVPKIGGWVNARFDSNDGKGPLHSSDTYRLQFARLYAMGHVSPELQYVIAVDAATGIVLVRDAYITYAWKPGVHITAGSFKKPFGYEVRTHEYKLIPLDKSLEAQYAQNFDDYDLGVMVSGKLAALEYGVAVVNGNSVFPDGDTHKDVIGRVGTSFGDESTGAGGATHGAGSGMKINVGLSGAGGRAESDLYAATGPVSGPFYYWRAGYDIEMMMAQLAIISEGVYGTSTFILPPGTPGHRTVTGSAAYILVGYMVNDDWMPWLKYDYRELSGGTASKGLNNVWASPTPIPDWNNAITIGVNYALIKKRATARAQYSMGSGFLPAGVTGGPPAKGEDLTGTLGVGIQVVFGNEP